MNNNHNLICKLNEFQYKNILYYKTENLHNSNFQFSYHIKHNPKEYRQAEKFIVTYVQSERAKIEQKFIHLNEAVRQAATYLFRTHGWQHCFLSLTQSADLEKRARRFRVWFCLFLSRAWFRAFGLCVRVGFTSDRRGFTSRTTWKHTNAVFKKPQPALYSFQWRVIVEILKIVSLLTFWRKKNSGKSVFRSENFEFSRKSCLSEIFFYWNY